MSIITWILLKIDHTIAIEWGVSHQSHGMAMLFLGIEDTQKKTSGAVILQWWMSFRRSRLLNVKFWLGPFGWKKKPVGLFPQPQVAKNMVAMMKNRDATKRLFRVDLLGMKSYPVGLGIIEL